MACDGEFSKNEWNETSAWEAPLPPPPPPPLPAVFKSAFWICGSGLNMEHNETLSRKQHQEDGLLLQERLEERCVTALATEKCLGNVDCELVAIFTALTNDGCLDNCDLERAIECLGLRSTKALRDRFGKKADRRSFVAQAKLELSSSDPRPRFLELFALFDRDNLGYIDVAAFRHILCEKNRRDRLSPTEFDDLLAAADIDPKSPYHQIDYAARLTNILTSFPYGETSL